MGVIAFRASPVWVLAALADVAGFGRQLIPEIAESLKKEGLLAPDGSFATMEQLLGGLERSSGQLAESVNAPPLDVAGLREEWRKFVARRGNCPRRNCRPPAPSRASGRTCVRRPSASSARCSKCRRCSPCPPSASCRSERACCRRRRPSCLRHGGAAVSNALLEHYRQSLQQMREVGFMRYGVRQLTPYTHAAIGAFHPARETLTGKLLDRF